MANLAAWYDDVLPHAPGCPLLLADWAIRDAAIAFCEESGAHIVDLAAINSVSGTATYTLAPAVTAWVTAHAYNVGEYATNGGNTYLCQTAHVAGVFATDLAALKWVISATLPVAIQKILAVQYDGTEIDPISPRDVARRYGQNWEDLQATPERYLSQAGSTLTLVPKPDTSITGGIVATVIYKPTSDCASIDDAVAIPYKRTIAQGARARLWLMSKKPWTDYNRGTKEEADFLDKCATAHVQAMKGRTSAPGRSRNFYYPQA